MDEKISLPERPAHRAARGHRWDQVELRPYKEDERALFKTVSRQILFSDPALDAELRYFEVAPGGFSTLERHEHMHAVMVLRGRGECLVGREVRKIELHDLVTVPPWTWHQFRASSEEPLGFLCMVNAARDKPQLPTEADLVELGSRPEVARFLAGDAGSSGR
jgi:quercetin dioxygenase-like cupin family protein